jgi:hypothetical protein
MSLTHQRSWHLALGVCMACLFAMVGFSGTAQATDDLKPHATIFVDPATGVRDGPALREDGAPVTETIDQKDRKRVVFDLVDQHYLVTSYDNLIDRAPSEIDVPFRQAILEDARADLRFVLFEDVSVVSHLSAATKQALLTKFESGKLILGAEGFARDLRKALGLITPDLYAAGTTEGGEGLWVLLHRSTNGHLDELTIAAPHDEDSRAVAFKLARKWYNRVDATVTDSTSPWNAIYNFEESGTIYGTFQNTFGPLGTFSFLLTVYFLADATDQNTDYYRFDYATVVAITDYEMTGNSFGDTSGNCGWWDKDQHADVTVTTPGGQWWRDGYMPSTTVGSTSESFTIGGDIGTSGPEGSAAYSMSYGTSDVTIEVFADTVDEWLLWEASLVGCDNYGAYPWYSGASDAAQSTYSLDPSFIAAVPNNALLEFNTTADGGADQWGFTVEKDHIYIDGADIKTDPYTTTYIEAISKTCNTTSCS